MAIRNRFHPRSLLPGIAFLGMLAAVAISVPSLRAQNTPTCDGMHCHKQWHCGTKCICNPFHHTCLDNTPN